MTTEYKDMMRAHYTRERFPVHEDAVLFAAAPELLDALKTLIEGIEHLDIHGADYARQVIAKAEGRDA